MITDRSRGAAPHAIPLWEVSRRAAASAQTGRSPALIAGAGGRISGDGRGVRSGGGQLGAQAG